MGSDKYTLNLLTWLLGWVFCTSFLFFWWDRSLVVGYEWSNLGYIVVNAKYKGGKALCLVTLRRWF